MDRIKLDTWMYWARIIPNSGIYNVINLHICTIYDGYFVGCKKRTISSQRYIFEEKDIENILFFDRKDALAKVKEAEKNKKEISNETYYEED